MFRPRRRIISALPVGRLSRLILAGFFLNSISVFRNPRADSQIANHVDRSLLTTRFQTWHAPKRPIWEWRPWIIGHANCIVR
jgi:hypothetical protein